MQETLFEDGKDPQAFRTIGEVSAALDIKPHVLRYWEEQFPMLRPVKRSGGRRYYRPADVELLQTIDRLLNRDGYTIRGAVKAIETGAGRAAPVVAGQVPTGPPPQIVARIRDAVRTLEQSTADTPAPPAAEGRGTDDALKARLRQIRAQLANALDP
ncbi:MerR family transcriptional regulator [Croceicoccus sp. BE223]|uniref:MerR family transcriptional regulator n=1 Tax=Croceicoccus sp. BE223 TaxID=2817716 RepID=UPI0028661BF6|nr:MerR family transcriptional regulator [Croceicoccus sp. BE223]MDR7104068.1 DNA-binding transcriptional MerR regulator [Croceicoccus sp. BE223]